MARITSSWDGTKPIPKNGTITDCFGVPNAKGKYVIWPIGSIQDVPDRVWVNVNGLLAKSEHNIAKLVIQHVRAKQWDYEYCKKNPIDLTNPKLGRKLYAKINSIMTKLGIVYADRAGMIMPKNDVASVAWFVDDATNKEGIAINPYWIIKAEVHHMMRLIKKEVIHRALYRNFSDLSNKRVLNFTLDVLAMRVVAQTPYDKLDKRSVELSEILFNPKLYKQYPILSLLDCSITDAQAKRLPSGIYDIWAMLYKPDENGFLPKVSQIKPSSLYFKIKPYLDELTLDKLSDNAGFNIKEGKAGSGTNYPFNISSNQKAGGGKTLKDENLSPAPDKAGKQLDDSIKKSFIPKHKRLGGGFSNSLSVFWEDHVVAKKEFADERMQEFAKKWHTDKLLENIDSKIKDEVARQNVKVEPYPEDLTDEGLMLAAIGYSGNIIPFYFNHAPDIKSNRKKIAAFFDVSPSMTYFWPYMIKITNNLEQDCDVSFTSGADGKQKGAYAFAGSVTELSEEDLEQMKKGKFKIGASTSFDAVIEHAVKEINDKENEHAPDIVVVFTDGESSLSSKNIEEFNKTGKKCFNVYFRPTEKITDAQVEITSDLNKLNGESFTLSLPRVETEETNSNN